MDVRMPRMDGVEATRRICGGGDRRPRVLILTTFDLDEYAFAALKAGATGFMLKDVPPDELLARDPRGAQRRRGGGAEHHPAAAGPLHADAAGPRRRAAAATSELGTAHRAGARGAAAGRRRACRTVRSPRTLVLSEATVKTHVGRILTKLDLRDRVQAVVLAYESGLVRAGGGGL